MRKLRLHRLLPVLFGIFAFAFPAAAEEEAKTPGMLLRYYSDEKPVEGAELSVTYVGNGSDDAYVYSYKLADYGLDPKERYFSGELMSGYLERDGVVPDHTAKTQANGMVAFSDLAPGDWLVTGVPMERDGKIYRVAPKVLRVDADDTPLDYEVKHTMEDKRTETVSYKVRKEWTFYDGETIPGSVSVDLLQDGMKINSAVLTADEGWTYVWKDLEPNHKYSVVESEVPEGFLVHSDAYEWDTVIENRSIQSEEPTTEDPSKDDPSNTDPTNEAPSGEDPTNEAPSADEPSGSGTTTDESKLMVRPEDLITEAAKETGTLPSTGKNILPVIGLVVSAGILVTAAVILFMTGRKRHR